MATPCRNRAGYASLALAIAPTFLLSLPAPAQIASSIYRTGDAQSTAPDLLITTHDVIGKLGAALSLEIKLVRVGSAEIEAIKLLGLPPGVTISDSANTFSPSRDINEVDISSWDLSKLQITQSGEFMSFPLAVAAIWTPQPGGYAEVTVGRLNVKFIQDSRDRTAAAGNQPGNPERFVAHNREATPIAKPIAPVTGLHAPVSDVFVPEAHVAPLNTAEIDRPAAPPVTHENSASEVKAAAVQRPVRPRSPPQVDPLVERARGLIQLGDISGARLLLERAQARNAPNATFLLAQTWDPAMLKTWKVRGLRADPDLARSLYAKAATQQPDERLLAATSR
jgi:hypothetical protein